MRSRGVDDPASDSTINLLLGRRVAERRHHVVGGPGLRAVVGAEPDLYLTSTRRPAVAGGSPRRFTQPHRPGEASGVRRRAITYRASPRADATQRATTSMQQPRSAHTTSTPTSAQARQARWSTPLAVARDPMRNARANSTRASQWSTAETSCPMTLDGLRGLGDAPSKVPLGRPEWMIAELSN